MSGSIFAPEPLCPFDELAALEPESHQSRVVAAAAAACARWIGRAESRRPRRDAILRDWRSAPADLTAADFETFRLAWIAEFRSYGRQTPECPDTFFATITQEKAA